MLDPERHAAPFLDILIEDETIREIGEPGLAAPEGTQVVVAADQLMHPGLINGHTHSHGNLAKGMGERWTLELLLTASPWISGNQQLEDKYLSTLIGACEMVLKGCTACYDLMGEFPTPSVDGLSAVAKAYSDVGMRAVIAPMVADASFFEAIPGLMDALPPALQKEVERLRMAPHEVTLQNLSDIVERWP
ncbi:MAG TPA: amidohydrolase family protein, partial [Pseudomonadales bacterium]